MSEADPKKLSPQMLKAFDRAVRALGGLDLTVDQIEGVANILQDMMVASMQEVGNAVKRTVEDLIAQEERKRGER